MRVSKSICMPDRLENNFGICWLHGPTLPWSWNYYIYTTRGAEYFHLYLWLFKDLSWTLDALVAGWLFGILAVLWSGFLVIRAIFFNNLYEAIVSTAQLLWLIANFWWMTGEVHDFWSPDEPPQYLVIK